MSFKFNESPYESIPKELKNGFTMDGKIPVFEWYFDGSKKNGLKWTNSIINEHLTRFTPENIKNNAEGKSSYGHEVCLNLLQSFEDYNIRHKNVAIIGSETPWIEAILLNMSNNVTTIEYNVPSGNFDNINLKCEDYFTHFEQNKTIYDTIVTFSSIEHSGLGRYGDPLDPNGDIKTMNNIHNNLKENSLLIWGAPVGKDAISWNAHRVYGPIRLPKLFHKFEEIKWYGSTKKQLFARPLRKNSYQPVVVLKKC